MRGNLGEDHTKIWFDFKATRGDIIHLDLTVHDSTPRTTSLACILP
jgi:hypothetical protein